MDDYLQNLRSLRMHMSDRESRTDELAAEEHKYRAAIAAAEEELERADAELNVNAAELDSISREKGNLSARILSCQKSIQALDAEYETLEQGWQLLELDIQKEAATFAEKRLFYDGHIQAAVAKQQELKIWYDSRPLEQEIHKVQLEIDQLAGQQHEPQLPERSSQMQEDRQKELHDLRNQLDEVTAELVKERQYMDSLKFPDQIMASRQLVCSSCGLSFKVDLQAAQDRRDSEMQTDHAPPN